MAVNDDREVSGFRAVGTAAGNVTGSTDGRPVIDWRPRKTGPGALGGERDARPVVGCRIRPLRTVTRRRSHSPGEIIR